MDKIISVLNDRIDKYKPLLLDTGGHISPTYESPIHSCTQNVRMYLRATIEYLEERKRFLNSFGDIDDDYDIQLN